MGRNASFGENLMGAAVIGIVGAVNLISPQAALQRVAAARLLFSGLEIRAVRSLAHVSEGTLKAMAQKGFAATTKNGDAIVLHHLNQNPAGPIVEMPARNHSISNAVQHPGGNAKGSGLTPEQRKAFAKWREEYWKARAKDELERRTQ